jgi:exodeoxyribonuclease VII large subunit
VSAALRAATFAGYRALEAALNRCRSALENAAARGGRAAADVGRSRERVLNLERRSDEAVQRRQIERREALGRCLARLTALDPQATLNRGYAVVHKGGSVVSSIAEVSRDDALTIKVADGGFPARVAAPGQKRRRPGSASRANGHRETEPSVQPALFP